MTFDPTRIEGYAPTIDDIMLDIGANTPADCGRTLLAKCKQLYNLAKNQGNIESYNTKHEFIICNSTDFYKTLVNMGNGNSALTILDDYSTEVYFLIFADKIPTKFRPIAAAHESTEYYWFKNHELDQRIAHIKASEIEISTAKRLGVKKEYLIFLKENYPTKLQNLKEWKII